eukprot:TRINITY_DN13213_c0_g1_i1.p1 TRINITY_DN13213_c0_g1~~TRINITY_DN13213_c0_g1_i1.p1  ORF type:complete len:273 (-),score=80.66 TRINITY_DN13213_c0_g1_i1:50-868(-)
MPKVKSSGFESVQGRRWNMEDCHLVIDNLNDKFPHLDKSVDRSFYAVFDGHGGRYSVLMTDELLLGAIVNHPSFSTDISAAIKEGFDQVDKEIYRRSTEENWVDGTTAAIVFVIGDTVWAANAGDSEILFGKRKDKEKYVHTVLSKIHRPSEAEEKARLASVSAVISNSRVGGRLAVSRGLGDHDQKAPKNGSNADWVSSEPYISSIAVEEGDFILIGCDGLWDEVTYQVATDMVTKARKSGKGVFDGCGLLRKESLDHGSLGNNTVVLAYF